MRDAAPRNGLLPIIPQPVSGDIIFRLNEDVLFQIVSRRQAVALNIFFRDNGNEMKLTQLSESNIG